ncbi:MAG: NAD(P)-dependent alcohol dehydrogenase [Microcella sp.]|uniref:NAD(P)-dependent alcohol dehydrogenase n=1 Tax=Microcella sp. TaxID=1913979 RepID=UPI0033148145
MRAVVQRGYGGPERLSVEQRPAPIPGRGQVRVRVEAVSPDSGTLHILTGEPRVLRPFVGQRTPRQPVIGLAFAGVVEQLGDGVDEWAIGDRVTGAAPAAFAELVVARADRVARIPDGVSSGDAATLPVSASTALQAVRDAARIEAGQRVLVIGAGGGVGSFLVQLAALRGAHVTAVVSAAKSPLARELGAERTIDYRATPDPVQWGAHDVVIDTADGRPLSVLRRALTPSGTLVIVGADGAGGPLLDGLERQLLATVLNPWVRHRLTSVVQRENAPDLRVLLDEMEGGRLRAPIDRVLTLEDAPEALRLQAERAVAGKLVLTV